MAAMAASSSHDIVPYLSSRTPIEAAAHEIIDTMSPYVRNALVADVPGRGLILFDEVATDEELLKNNIGVVKAIIRNFPDSVPSTYSIASIFMWVDKLLAGMLYRGEDTFKMKMSLAEASNGKQLVQAMRRSCRRSVNSRTPELAEIKGMMRFPIKSVAVAAEVPPCEVGFVGDEVGPVQLHGMQNEVGPGEADVMHDEVDAFWRAAHLTDFCPPAACHPVAVIAADGFGEHADLCSASTTTSSAEKHGAASSATLVAVKLDEDAPACKKPRIMHLERPSFAATVAAEVAKPEAELPLATPKAQGAKPPAENISWDVEAQPMPDLARTIPEIFPPDVHGIYMRLPERCLPQKPGKGKYNYTIKDSTGATIEVQLSNKLFRVQRTRGGQAWSCPDQGSPNCKWASFESLDLAFDQCMEWAGGWTV